NELCDSAYSPELCPSSLSSLESCRSALRIKTVSIRGTSLVRGPLTIGTWAPQILLPAEILATLSQDEWMSVLSHEMAHVYRKDFVKNFAFELLCTPISYHPLVLLMKSRVASAREMACDELPTARCIEPQRYMRSLLTMAGRMSHLQCADSLNYGVGIFDGQMLEERIMKLLNK